MALDDRSVRRFHCRLRISVGVSDRAILWLFQIVRDHVKHEPEKNQREQTLKYS